MAAIKYWRVRNWDRYQHYKTGKHASSSPAWVKLYVSILDDYDLTSLPVAAQLLADRLLLVAARTDNTIPNDTGYIADATRMERRYVTDALPRIRAIGFIEPKKVYTKSRPSLEQRREREEKSREETPLPPFSIEAVENLARLEELTNGVLRSVA